MLFTLSIGFKKERSEIKPLR